MPTTKPRIYSNIVQGYSRSTSNPGERIDPITGRLAIHAGVDIAVAVGIPIKTPADGQIWALGSTPAGSGYGNYVVVAHPNVEAPTAFTLYGHLSDPVVLRRGEPVIAGDTLGLSGNTGRSTGPHLHYEERVLAPGQVVSYGTDAQTPWC